MGHAQQAAARLHEATAIAPDRTFLALSHSLMAKVAIAAGDLQEARAQLPRAIAIVRNAGLPVAAWRVYATAASFYESIGDTNKAVEYRARFDGVAQSLAKSLAPDDLAARGRIVLRRAAISGLRHRLVGKFGNTLRFVYRLMIFIVTKYA